MNDLNNYMDTEKSMFGVLRDHVQVILNRKEDLVSRESLRALSVDNMEDTKKLGRAYEESINYNSKVIDLMRDIKDEILKLGMLKERLDTNTQLGIQQIRQIESLIKILREVYDIIELEKSKADRLVRYYEKTAVYYNNF